MSDWLSLPTICPEHGIDKLRAQVDFSPYQPATDAPVWMSRLAAQARKDLGVVGLLGPNGLSVATPENHHVRPALDPPGLYLAGLTDGLRQSGERLAIAIPPAGQHLPLLFAASAVLANTFDRNLGKKPAGVLVISPDLDLRSRYCDLFVGKERLESAHPGSRLRPSGERVMLRPKAPNTDEGVCFFLPGLALPHHVQAWPDLVILDFRFGKWVRRATDLCAWATRWKSAGLVAIYTMGDYDTEAVLTKHRFRDFPMDHRALSTCALKSAGLRGANPEHAVDWQVGRAADFLSRRHEMHQVSSEAVEGLIQQIAQLLGQHAQKDSPDLNRAKWLLAMLSQMPVPLLWYEQNAAMHGRFTLSRLVERLGIQSTSGEGLGAVIQSLKLLLSELHFELGESNPRAIALKNLLPRLARKDVGVIQILARDRTTAHALETWLSVEVFAGEEWLTRVQIQACSGYESVALQQPSTTLLSGPFPRRYRWLAGADLGKSAHFLAYRHEFEVIERQLAGFYGSTECESRRRLREEVLIGKADSDSRADGPLPALYITKPPSPEKKPKPVSLRTGGGLSDLGSILREVRRAEEKSARVAEPPLYREPDTDEGEDLGEGAFSSEFLPSENCIRLRLRSHSEGTGTLILPQSAMIDCIRLSVDEELKRLPAADLKVGDVVLLVGEQRRAGLFDLVVDLAECQPSMQYLAAFRRRWRSAVHMMASKYGLQQGKGYSKLLQDLKANGATVDSEAAVRLWVQDQIIGPETLESIRAVGAVASNAAVSSQAKDFFQAFKRIRGLRRGIGNRLSNLIRKSFKHLAAGNSVASPNGLEERLGLPLDELMETVDIAEVLGVDALTTAPVGGIVGQFIKM